MEEIFLPSGGSGFSHICSLVVEWYIIIKIITVITKKMWTETVSSIVNGLSSFPS